ncbi:hypothetical protein GCM10028801_44900 [Nocardioides maradonensis]
MTREPNYVEQAAAAWAATDPLERWVDAAPDGPSPIEDTVGEYLGNHNPFPDGMAVDVEVRGGQAWEPAVIVERVGVDEWTVQYEDGKQGWRDHSELRPAVQQGKR